MTNARASRLPRGCAKLAVMRASKITATILLLFAASPTVHAGDEIDCSGLFGRDTSHAALVNAFGAENVVYKKIDAPQGSTGMATIVFERRRERRLLIEWHDEEKRARPIYIGIDGKSEWIAPLGIKIGALIAEVEKQNGKPFRLNGFGWDLGGAARFGKENGRLGDLPGGCSLGLTFEPTAEGLPLGGKYRVLNGNRDLRSDLPLLREVKPAVVEIFIVYPENH
jgi:hypothetical protein